MNAGRGARLSGGEILNRYRFTLIEARRLNLDRWNVHRDRKSAGAPRITRGSNRDRPFAFPERIISARRSIGVGPLRNVERNARWVSLGATAQRSDRYDLS